MAGDALEAILGPRAAELRPMVSFFVDAVRREDRDVLDALDALIRDRRRVRGSRYDATSASVSASRWPRGRSRPPWAPSSWLLAAQVTRARAWHHLGARTRASVLVQARLAPLAVALVLVPLVQLAFWRFEPEHHSETTGAALPLLAAGGVVPARRRRPPGLAVAARHGASGLRVAARRRTVDHPGLAGPRLDRA